MAAPGQSATYFNFDNFEEVHVSTAGNDVRERTGALTVDMVVKRGGNQYHGGARGYFANDSLQASNTPEELTTLAVPVTDATSDHITKSTDYGFDLGGPLIRNRAWFYGSYSRQDVGLFRRTTQAIDRTRLDDPNLKINWQATPKDMVNFLFYNGYKIKDHRKPGLATTEAPEATFHQDNFYSDSSPLHGLWKVADDRVLGSNAFLSMKYAYFNTGVALTPEGGFDAQAGFNAPASTTYGSIQRQVSSRPQHTATADAHSFFTKLGGTNDVKYGGGYRTTDVITENMWPGNGIRAIYQTATDLRAQAFREGRGGNRANYLHAYVGDTLSRTRMTITAGVRFDRQWGSADASTTESNPAFPALVPGIVFPGYRAPFTWNNLSPRASFTYSLDESHKTNARVSYSSSAGQLATSTIGFMNPASPRRDYLPLGRRQRRSLRAGERSRHHPGAVNERYQREQSDRGRLAQPGRSEPDGAGDADVRRRSRSRADAAPRGAGGIHLFAQQQPVRQLGGEHHAARRRAARRRLHDRPDADRYTAGRLGLQRADVRPDLGARERWRRRLPDDERAGLLHRLQRRRAADDEAPLEEMDGPRVVRVQQRARALRRRGGTV
jgi:hypothetical protein